MDNLGQRKNTILLCFAVGLLLTALVQTLNPYAEQQLEKNI